MHTLTVFCDDGYTEVEFEGTPLLSDVLEKAGIALRRPCGGNGSCGKCVVQSLTGEVSEPNDKELLAGKRLSCQARLFGNAQVELPREKAMKQIQFYDSQMHQNIHIPILSEETKADADLGADADMGTAAEIGAAVDIGTTTVALQLYDLNSGKCLSSVGAENAQTAVAADVMGRIEAAMGGKLERLKLQVMQTVEQLLKEACQKGQIEENAVKSLVLAGNTTMLHLLTGRSPKALSAAPFRAEYLFDETLEILGRKSYLPPCISAFVGADISCALLAVSQLKKERISLLCDIGTNGEIALWKEDVLYVCSTAAGPAFEGAGISCGCSSIAGAIDHVEFTDGQILAHTIDGKPAVGICGSGLIDAVAAFLDSEEIDETGAMEKEELLLRDAVALQPADIREIQLAKAAIAAGIETLMEFAKIQAEEVEVLYIAGGFGSHLRTESAVRIGLIPAELQQKVKVVGNAALAGASRLLLDQKEQKRLREIVSHAQSVNLGGDPKFNENYINHMFFPEEE